MGTNLYSTFRNLAPAVTGVLLHRLGELIQQALDVSLESFIVFPQSPQLEACVTSGAK